MMVNIGYTICAELQAVWAVYCFHHRWDYWTAIAAVSCCITLVDYLRNQQ